MEASGIKDHMLCHVQPCVQWMRHIVSCMVVWIAGNKMSSKSLKINEKPHEKWLKSWIEILKSWLKS